MSQNQRFFFAFNSSKVGSQKTDSGVPIIISIDADLVRRFFGVILSFVRIHQQQRVFAWLRRERSSIVPVVTSLVLEFLLEVCNSSIGTDRSLHGVLSRLSLDVYNTRYLIIYE